MTKTCKITISGPGAASRECGAIAVEFDARRGYHVCAEHSDNAPAGAQKGGE